ncbi:hypothetical protein [Streptomyces nigra]|uniref:hypothetical protein n=1 Tax=Streptomyces nigra TaxID=1827580 RepID=UPI00365F8A39
MEEKKDLKDRVADGLAQLIKNSGDWGFARYPNGTLETAFTISLTSSRSYRVKIERSPTGRLHFDCDPNHTIPGQVKKPPRGKVVR